jgi:hypothetical protein
MELGPDLIALLTRLQGLDPAVLDGLLGNPVGAAGGAPVGHPAPGAPVPPIGARVVVSSPPLTILEKFRPPAADPLMLLRPSSTSTRATRPTDLLIYSPLPRRSVPFWWWV